MKDAITCPTCEGRGEVELARIYPRQAATLALIRERGEMTSTELWEAVSGKPGTLTITAMNNRMDKLRRVGFLAREKRGREYVYRESDASKRLRLRSERQP